MFLAATPVAMGLLTLVHIFFGRLQFLNRNPVVWKSAAGGGGIAYAFLVLLPKLARAQVVLEQVTDRGFYGFLVHHSYLAALVGLIIYYGMDAVVKDVLARPDQQALRPTVRLIVIEILSGLDL